VDGASAPARRPARPPALVAPLCGWGDRGGAGGDDGLALRLLYHG